MGKDIFENIIVSFDKPKDLKISTYEFIKNPPQIDGGGFNAQIAIVKEEFSFKSLLEYFYKTAGGLSFMMEGKPLYITSAIISLSLNLPIVLRHFPDEYQDILELIVNTERGYKLSSLRLDELIEENPETEILLDKLVKEKFLRKNRKGEYIVRRKVLTNISVSFIK